MRYYPVSLDLHGIRCLVVGAGRVGRRKIGTLLECGPASIVVLDPGLDGVPAEFADAAACGAVVFRKSPFSPEDIEGMGLVFAATPSAEVNTRIAQACRKKGILCNVAGPADDGVSGSFLVPAHLQEGRITLTVSTEGGSPALSRALKHDLKALIGRGYPLLADLLDAIRPHVLALGLGSDADADIFRAICARPLRDSLAEALARGDAPQADALLSQVLPAELNFSTNEILHD
ncbi:MAG: bifunctional precorrin-2 dehydrogenase/sirohydrochlorin ferrochelatase [Mailhella sp.]|nr:bifunctional precorrin-2 dehydrogenase/sirohydrochlorin ferrochelatase [Mailhella sp.]